MAPRHHGTAIGGQLRIPKAQLGVSALGGGAGILVAQCFKQAVALGNHLLEFRERSAIVTVDLAERNIEIAPPLARAAIDQFDVRGQEKDGRQQAQQIHAPLVNAVDLHLLGIVDPIPAPREDDLQR